ncbi:MAG: LmeA family phospholipid-binding protein, partial [Trebonia sp.]
MIIDLLMSPDGLRIDQVEITLSRVHVAREPGGFTPRAAERLRGTLRLAFADLASALARPELLDQLLSGVSG